LPEKLKKECNENEYNLFWKLKFEEAEMKLATMTKDGTILLPKEMIEKT